MHSIDLIITFVVAELNRLNMIRNKINKIKGFAAGFNSAKVVSIHTGGFSYKFIRLISGGLFLCNTVWIISRSRIRDLKMFASNTS